MTVPRLDLAPKLNRPLSLWNPLDYLRLLYWVFFFPQALRWYVETFGTEENDIESVPVRQFINTLRIDPAQRNLFIQANLLMLTVPVGLAYLLQIAGMEITRLGVAFGIITGVIAGVAYGVTYGIARGVSFGMVFGIIVGVLGGAALGVEERLAGGVAFGAAGGVAGGVARGVARGVVFGVVVGMTGGVVVGIAGGVVVGVAFGVAVSLASSRFFPDYILIYFPNWLSWKIAPGKSVSALSHVTWLPLPGLEETLLTWLHKDSTNGIHNLNQILAYSLQFIPVVRAANRWLIRQPAEKLLINVNALAQKPFYWNLLHFGSTSLKATMWNISINSTFFLPGRIKRAIQKRFDTSLSLATPAQAACAGYWSLHRKDSFAVTAFEHVRKLLHGKILYHSARALFNGLEQKDLDDIATWAGENVWLENIDEEPLRPQAVQTLRRLRAIALEAAVARESLSKLNRSAALGRAVSALTELIGDVEQTCPYPEHPLVKDIAVQWRDVLSLAAGQAGQVAITRPVENPFVVGNPVSGQAFVGREEIFQRLEELWGSAENRQVASVVLFGHRRMGKSSILQNLGAHRFGARTLVAYFTMQRAPRLENTGQFLGYLALAIHDAAASAGIRLAEPNPDSFRADGYLSFNTFLRQLKARLEGRRVILAIDEFESIEAQIASRRLDAELLDFLRGVIHSEPWLILVLAGLHTLEEMTADYWNPLFASVTPIKVSFLSLGATAELLANPHPDFPLDFTHDTVRRIYEHARGQPYLTQLVGHTLVRRYNQEVFERQRPRSPQFTPAEVDEIIASPEFYEQGSYYFTGVWSQAEKGGPPGQTALLRVLASAPAPLGDTDLFHASGLDSVTAQAALETLIRHDVISRAEGGCDFTVPLLRQWVNAHALKA